MTERYSSGAISAAQELPEQGETFSPAEFSHRMQGDSEVMANATVDLGEKVSDFIERDPAAALNPELEQRNRHIQQGLGNFAFVRDAVARGDIKGITKVQQRRLEQLEEDAEDILATITDGEFDPSKDAFRQLEQVFSEGQYVAPESIAPDLAAEISEGSQLVAELVRAEKIKPGDPHRAYLSKRIAVATAKAIDLPAPREEWEKAA